MLCPSRQREVLMTSPTPLMTVDDVAAYLQVNTDWVRIAARAGEIPCVKIGKRWRFRQEEVQAWVQEHSTR